MTAYIYLSLFSASFLLIILLWFVAVHFLFQEGNLESVEKMALSVGISLALIPLIGLALNYSPLGIKLSPVLVSLLLLTVVLGAVAVASRHRLKTKVEDTLYRRARSTPYRFST